MMWKLAISCFYILSIPATAFAGIPGIRYMSQDTKGLFNVTCLNGSSETVDAKSILENLVCKMDNQPLRQSKAITCTGDEFTDRFFVTRVSDGKRLASVGDRLSLNACQEVVKASKPEIVCTGDEFSDRFDLTRVTDNKKFGNRLSLKTCLQFSKSNGDK